MVRQDREMAKLKGELEGPVKGDAMPTECRDHMLAGR
jgi:hypothetical protein